MRTLYLSLTVCILFSCQKYDPLPDEASINIFHPDSGIELVHFDTCYSYVDVFNRVYIHWTPQFHLFPDTSLLAGTKVYRNGVFISGIPNGDYDFENSQLLSGQTYDYQISFFYDGRNTKLSAPCSVTVD